MRSALSILIVAALAATARAQTKLEVTGTPTKAEVPLGADIEIDVQVKNAGTADVELPELTFDARSVSFEISYEGGKLAWDTQFHVDTPRSAMEPDPLTPIKRSTLKAGASWEKKLTIPAIAAGSWSITAVYGGATTPEPRSLSVFTDANRLVKTKGPAKTVKVLPGPKGETEVEAKISTSVGTFAMQFFPKEALGTALNFVRIVQSGFYEGKQFFRIDDSLQIIQGGAASSSSSYEWTIPREQGLPHKPFSVAMARSGDPNSGGAQFYVTYGPLAQSLDRPDGYAVFARVVKGKDVIETMAAVKTRGGPGMMGQAPTMTLAIESAKVQLAPKE